ncbi:MAG TPA: MliC family protein [Candidatus Paceibacterota bacterium]|nr:MliC family protein [Candidatus Pacearchaeota archaeon]HRZ50363.1 MliC family protein [Candidatus Paceibacterota bacterium]HSA36084.1 MliC family protein [Candidatus Paceibacterota bacterium]
MNKKIYLALIFILAAVVYAAGLRRPGGDVYENKAFSPDAEPVQTVSLIAEASYSCDGDKTIKASFYKGETIEVKPGEPPVPTGSVKIVLSDGRNYDLPQTISANGGRYANADESFVFWSKGDAAIVLENGVEKDYTGCVVPSKQ